jgi:diguanylate cyclase (GGDEF)-like protein
MAQKAELDEANQRLDLLARTDWLTGLPNRREMTDRISKELAGEFGLFHPFVLILCDVDDFKAINDRYGHGTGDSVLRTLGQRLRELLRGYDSAGRWGGEEFLLLLPGSEVENGTAVARRIHQEISHSVFECDGQGLTLTMTFGVVLCDSPQKSIEEYLKAADRALYRGKQQGKNQVVTFGNPDDILHAQAG